MRVYLLSPVSTIGGQDHTVVAVLVFHHLVFLYLLVQLVKDTFRITPWEFRVCTTINKNGFNLTFVFRNKVFNDSETVNVSFYSTIITITD